MAVPPMPGDFYDFDGNPIEYHEWIRLFFTTHDRHVANDLIGDVQISTVWMGIDYGFGHGGTPLIYETMIFGGDHDRNGVRPTGTLHLRATTRPSHLYVRRPHAPAKRVRGMREGDSLGPVYLPLRTA
jgi:hypothetical protein